jgi:hypothetical protein
MEKKSQKSPYLDNEFLNCRQNKAGFLSDWLTCSQIWLIPLLDEDMYPHSTVHLLDKIGEKKKKKKKTLRTGGYLAMFFIFHFFKLEIKPE